MGHCSGYTRSPGLDSHSLLSSLEPLPCLSASEVGPVVLASPEDIEGEGNPYRSGILSVRKLPLVPDAVGFLLPSPCILPSLSQAADLGMAWAIKYLTPSEA